MVSVTSPSSLQSRIVLCTCGFTESFEISPRGQGCPASESLCGQGGSQSIQGLMHPVCHPRATAGAAAVLLSLLPQPLQVLHLPPGLQGRTEDGLQGWKGAVAGRH